MAKLKYFCIKHGRKFLLASLFVVSGLLIAHFVSQYYFKASLIDALFAPQALIVKPTGISIPKPAPAPIIDKEPKGGSAPAPSSAPTKPPNDDIKVEVFGLLKFEMNESNSWQTIAKILTVILGTFAGIRAINAIFNRLEDHDQEPNPAK